MQARKIIGLVLGLTLTLQAAAVTLETTPSLNVYYPDFTTIDLVCGQMPPTGSTGV